LPVELGRALQELLDFLEFLDGLVGAGHVRERGLRGVLGDQLGAGLAEVHHARAAALHLRQHEEEEQEDDQVNQGGGDDVEQRVALGDRDVVAAGEVALVVLVLQGLLQHQTLAGHPVGLVVLAALGGDLDRLVLVRDQRALDLAVVDQLDDLGGIDLLVRTAGIGVVEHEKQQQHRDGNEQQRGSEKAP
jgi:hypothetical protein